MAVCVFSILTWIFFRGEAPSPPSSAASQSTSSANVTIWREIYDLLRSWPFWILLFVFGSFTGGFWVLATFFDQILSPLGYDEETIAVCGIVFLAVRPVLGASPLARPFECTHLLDAPTLLIIL